VHLHVQGEMELRVDVVAALAALPRPIALMVLQMLVEMPLLVAPVLAQMACERLFPSVDEDMCGHPVFVGTGVGARGALDRLVLDCERLFLDGEVGVRSKRDLNGLLQRVRVEMPLERRQIGGDVATTGTFEVLVALMVVHMVLKRLLLSRFEGALLALVALGLLLDSRRSRRQHYVVGLHVVV